MANIIYILQDHHLQLRIYYITVFNEVKKLSCIPEGSAFIFDARGELFSDILFNGRKI